MVFTTNEALVKWMQEDGLGAFTLLKLTPRPTKTGRKLPDGLVMEWGLEDLEYEGEKDKYDAWRLTAAGVRCYRRDGRIDLSEECTVALGGGPSIDIRLEVGAMITLQCERLLLDKEVPARFRKGRPQPHHGEFTIESDLAGVTVGQLREWLGISADHVCLGARTGERFHDDASAFEAASASNTHFADSEGHGMVWIGLRSKDPTELVISRGKWAPDDLWLTVWSSFKRIPRVKTIFSRTMVSPPDVWPDVPPPKPAPQVWPEIFGVKCDFADMTFEELREALGLAGDCRFHFDSIDLQCTPTLTLGEAVLHDATNSFVGGTFRDLDGSSLVHCFASTREGELTIKREKATSDDVWRRVWQAYKRLPNARELSSRTTQSPPDPWPDEPPT